jgi:protein AaeX
MTGEMHFGGVLAPTLMVWALLALFLLMAVRKLLARLGVYRWVWHPALFDTALYLVLLQGVSLATAHLQFLNA